ncbi:MAG: PH domain-containing protein [Acidobacteriota bacterium]
MTTTPVPTLESVREITRPHKSLFEYYALRSLLAGPFFLLPLVPLYFRYHTLRYRFDGEGIHMRWGILFRREINLTYARIQDIHLVSNVVERWLGLARIQIQTASGSARAEMTIEGIRDYELLRDFLYSRMRGAQGASPAEASGRPDGRRETEGDLAAATAAVLEAASELRAVREALEGAGGPRGKG